ncbi:DNA repair protein RecN [Lysobacter pythonis]|uniref:DNA repair protein RecN n=1 Tax=Solilutibacter pythonis TaxID=2483112 RepID=A0A3M2HYD7_9GAMM|nr:DNA repair protein RecN [Lysobacter pythonis]RMH94741.1 DNA repair protein RecN [Lysobacter pythonis]
MLTRLAIADFAVVQRAELEFSPGMTVISGETGAGKSLLVDALGFLSGQRADAGVVRHGAERAELSAEFDLADAPAARAWLAGQEMDDGEGGCQLRRVLRADGGSKSWINGRLANATQLAELAGLLVEIHGQHAQQALLSRPAQLRLLDDYGRHQALLKAVAEATAHWQALRRERDELNHRGDVGERLEFLRHQWRELENETLDADSLVALDAEHRRQAHGTELLAANAETRALLSESDETNALALLHRARATLAGAIAHEPRLAEIDAMLESAAIALDEAADALTRLGDDLDLDPGRFAELDARLQRLHALARKHRVGIDELATLRENIANELERLESAESRLAGLDTEIAAAEAAWRKAAEKLSAARAGAAERLATATAAIVHELGMGNAEFHIALLPEAGLAPNALGAERSEFLFAANPGQPPKPLRKVASGGELSRISLAIEVAAIGIDTVPTMVFDEVDSGISGGVAEVVGRKLRALGARAQVMCVTHLPQVAAQGHAHWRVRKASAGDVTMSQVERLDGDGRVEDIARLLGGVHISDAARAAARSLLADVT